MSQISRKLPSSSTLPAGWLRPFESFSGLGINKFKDLMICVSVRFAKGEFDTHVSFAPADATACKARRYSK